MFPLSFRGKRQSNGRVSRQYTGALEILILLALGVVGTSAQQRGFDSTDDFNSAPFIFNSLASLLKSFPNVVHPTGFAVVPVTVPAHTLLYHARTDSVLPPSPEWLAFHPTMSYFIMSYSTPSNLVLHTYASTRSLKLLYFDGHSGAKWAGLPNGWVDSQEVFVRGNGKSDDDTPIDHRNGDYPLASKLCAWATPLGVDGFVRMGGGLLFVFSFSFS